MRYYSTIFIFLFLISLVGAQLDVAEDTTTVEGVSIIQKVATGVSTFLGLTDTPASYTGEGNKCVAVKNDETGLEFLNCSIGGSITNLGELGDVNIPSPSDGDSLVYNSTLSLWTAQAITSSSNIWQKIGDTISPVDAGTNLDVSSGGGNVTANYFFGDGSQLTNIDVQLNSTNYLGSDFSGSNGEVNRTLSISANTAIVVMERQTLIPDTDYAISNGVLNISLAVFDVYRITISKKAGLQYVNYLGSDLSGTNPSRYITTSDVPEVVALERQHLRPTDDYTYNGTDVVFNIPVQNQMRFTLWT